MQTMTDITLYAWATPNSHRAIIMLEELGVPYRLHPVNIRAGEQFRPPMDTLNPFGKVPVLTWREAEGSRTLSESGAILLRLAERYGRLLPAQGASRDAVLQWLMVALTGLAPATGQAHHWRDLARERVDAAIAHAVAAVQRVYELLENRLEDHDYLAGDYSIADIAAYPWVVRCGWAGLRLDDYPAVAGWHGRLSERLAVQRGMAQPPGVTLD